MYTSVTRAHEHQSLNSEKAFHNSVNVYFAFMIGVSVAGFAVALWAHVTAMSGTDPRTQFPSLWVVQLVLFALLLPIVVMVFRRGLKSDVLRSPKWAQRVFAVFLAYYAIHFYYFLYIASQELDSGHTWRMFSAGWLLLFYATAVYYWVRFSERSMLDGTND